MIDLDPERVLKNPWLWDEMTLAWARQQLKQTSSATDRTS